MNNCPCNGEELTPANTLAENILNTDYPDSMIKGLIDSMREADNGELAPYTGLRDILGY